MQQVVNKAKFTLQSEITEKMKQPVAVQKTVRRIQQRHIQLTTPTKLLSMKPRSRGNPSEQNEDVVSQVRLIKAVCLAM